MGRRTRIACLSAPSQKPIAGRSDTGSLTTTPSTSGLLAEDLIHGQGDVDAVPGEVHREEVAGPRRGARRFPATQVCQDQALPERLAPSLHVVGQGWARMPFLAHEGRGSGQTRREEGDRGDRPPTRPARHSCRPPASPGGAERRSSRTLGRNEKTMSENAKPDWNRSSARAVT